MSIDQLPEVSTTEGVFPVVTADFVDSYMERRRGRTRAPAAPGARPAPPARARSTSAAPAAPTALPATFDLAAWMDELPLSQAKYYTAVIGEWEMPLELRNTIGTIDNTLARIEHDYRNVTAWLNSPAAVELAKAKPAEAQVAFSRAHRAIMDCQQAFPVLVADRQTLMNMNAQRLHNDRVLLLDAIPTWSDPEAMAADLANGFLEHMMVLCPDHVPSLDELREEYHRAEWRNRPRGAGTGRSNKPKYTPSNKPKNKQAQISAIAKLLAGGR